MAVRAAPQRFRLARAPLSVVGTTRVLLKRLRTEAPAVAAVLAVVGLTSFVLAAAPRALGEMADDGLRHAVAEAGALERDVEILRALRVPAGPEGEPFAQVEARGEELESLLGSVRSVVGERTATVDAPRYSIFAGPPLPGATRHVTLRQTTGALDNVRIVEGRLPGPTTTRTRVRIVDQTRDAHALEVVLSRTAAGLLAVGTGDRLVLLSDPGDPLIRNVPLAERSPLVLHVTGLWEPRDPGSAFWAAQAPLNEPLVEETPGGDHRFVFAYGLFAPEAYGALTEAMRPMPLQYTWRYDAEPEAFDADGLPAVEADLRRLDARYGRFVRPTDTFVRTTLPAVLDRYRSSRNLATTLLATVELGLLVAALAVVGLLAFLVVERRREAISLARSRGASAGQVLAAQAAEAIVLAAPVAMVAYLLAVLVVDGPASSLSALSVAGLVAATAALLVALAAGPAARAVPLETREDAASGRPSPRRLVLEGLVVAVSLGGAYLLRRRGLSGEEGAEVDPYLAAVPVLLALAVGIVALRLYPFPVAALSRLAARRRDLVPALGTRRVARRSAATGVPLLVIVLAVTVAVFAAVEVETIERGQTEVSRARVGSDHRIDADGALPAGAAEAVAREADAVAEAWVSEGARVVTGGAGTLGGVTVVALEDEYAAVADTPAGEPLPSREGGGPIPGVVSGGPVQGAPIVLGRPFTVEVQGQRVELVAVERRERLAGMPAGAPVVAVPLDALRAALGERIVQSNRLYVRGGAADALREAVPGATVLSSREVYRSLGASPLAAGTMDGFRAGAVLGGMLAALTVVLAAALTARARARDVAYLRALGLSSRQALGLVALELGPPAVVALALGIALGLAVPHLIAPGIDLTAFTGVEPMITADLTAVALFAGAFLAVLALAVTAAGASARRAELGRALRAEER
ncbi:MAG TPA: ABC transporter permease [Gaiellaceae bacterium]|nr:ABC transporter permease [Gaiellaceae bacterium]